MWDLHIGNIRTKPLSLIDNAEKPIGNSELLAALIDRRPPIRQGVAWPPCKLLISIKIAALLARVDRDWHMLTGYIVIALTYSVNSVTTNIAIAGPNISSENFKFPVV